MGDEKPRPSLTNKIVAYILTGLILALFLAYLVVFVVVGFAPEIRVLRQFF